MSYSAKYPEQIAALLVEDMDIRTRPMSMNIFQRKEFDREETIAFNRELKTTSTDEISHLFEMEGYSSTSVEKWISEGRIVLQTREVGKATIDNDGDDNENDKDNNDHDSGEASSWFYSEVNPAFRLLCYEQFFITDHGEKTWKRIANNTSYSFPCHIMVAGKEGTVCDNESIWRMQSLMKEKSYLRMILHRYKDATHSIHNSARKSFMVDLQRIIQDHTMIPYS